MALTIDFCHSLSISPKIGTSFLVYFISFFSFIDDLLFVVKLTEREEKLVLVVFLLVYLDQRKPF